KQHSRQILAAHFSAIEDDLEQACVIAFGKMVRSFFVVGICAAIEKELREISVLRETGGAVDGGFPEGAVLTRVFFPPAGVRAGASVEECFRSGDEISRAIFVEAQITGEAEIGQGVPVVWAAFGG